MKRIHLIAALICIGLDRVLSQTTVPSMAPSTGSISATTSELPTAVATALPTAAATTISSNTTSTAPSMAPSAVTSTAATEVPTTAVTILPTVAATTASSSSPNTASTTAPSEDTSSPCSQLNAGDVVLTLMNSDDPDQMAFFLLANIPTAVETLYVTDQAWNGSAFMGNGEAILAYTIPNSTTGVNGETFEGLGVGGLFSYGFGVEDERWSVVQGSGDSAMDDTPLFNLGLSGDTILLYCLTSTGTPHFLSGFSYAPSGWVEAGLTAEEYGGVDSSLPEELAVNGSVAVPYFQNNIYIGQSTAVTTQAELMRSYGDPNNYKGSNDVPYQLPTLTEASAADTLYGQGVVAIILTFVLGFMSA